MTTKKISPNRRRWQLHSPIAVSISAAEKAALKQIPLTAWTQFSANQGTATHWYTLGFRLRVGFELAHKLYEAAASEGMQEALSAHSAIRQRYHAAGGAQWHATGEELELLKMGLEATDAIQDQTLRRDQLPAFYAADAFMKKSALI